MENQHAAVSVAVGACSAAAAATAAAAVVLVLVVVSVSQAVKQKRARTNQPGKLDRGAFACHAFEPEFILLYGTIGALRGVGCVQVALGSCQTFGLH